MLRRRDQNIDARLVHEPIEECSIERGGVLALGDVEHDGSPGPCEFAGDGATLSNPLTQMNPFRLRQTKLQAQLPGACSGVRAPHQNAASSAVWARHSITQVKFNS
jgi:hypothetical protein